MFQRRDLVVIGALSIVTLGLFNIYLVWRWTHEMNTFLGREKYISWLPLLLGILTFGLSGCVFESLYALDVEKEVKERSLPVVEAESAKVIVAFNVLAFLLGLTGVGWIVGFIFGTASCLLMQRTINKLAELETTTALLRGVGVHGGMSTAASSTLTR